MAKLFQVILKGLYQGQQIINSLTFVSDNDNETTATGRGLAQALGYVPATPTTAANDRFFRAYLDAQTTAFQLEEVLSRNLFDVNDFYTVALSGTGWAGTQDASAQGSMSFVASKIMTNRVRQDIGRGSLALTPMVEINYLPDGTLVTGALAQLQAVCDELNQEPSWTDGTDTTQFIPAVFQKKEYDVPNSGTPPRTAYKFYPSPEEQLEHAAVGVTWNPKPRATSQTTRRIGKGA
uniref:Uncharacterized protein n=1 Tax=uncultured prokaryote TaxID=198431 RepID=A0A0H5Q0R3_9ZZZZ|nr:hypothetical protein [uncultured prokaryote]